MQFSFNYYVGNSASVWVYLIICVGGSRTVIGSDVCEEGMCSVMTCEGGIYWLAIEYFAAVGSSWANKEEDLFAG